MVGMRGAEAIVRKSKLLGKPVVIKERVPKTYRIKTLDTKLRTERTRSEARLLHKAKLADVYCPTVLEVEDFSLTLSFLSGKRPRLDKDPDLAKKAGRLLAKLHAADIIHGDFTPANLILATDGSLGIIDFGLGFVSKNVEDKATDVFTMLRSFGGKSELVSRSKSAFLSGYKGYPDSESVLKRLEKIEQRVRYAF